MKQLLLFTALLLFSFHTNAQSYEWQPPCYENETKPVPWKTPAPEIRSFSKKVRVNIAIRSFTWHNQSYNVNFSYKNRIRYETGLVPVTDSLAISFSLAKTQSHGRNVYLYQFSFYKNKGCWVSLSKFLHMEVWSKEIPLDGMAIGYPEDKNYFTITDGTLTLLND